ncbi:MAG: asparagine synthase (glutamine-hydrolyzing) [Patiriisocius sp.]|jgi:asparagine synthase (glutamine-hydrolysing)
MCGISGIWRWKGGALNKEELKEFNDTMIHRGPDGEGQRIFEEDNLGLAQRRLSILDLSDDGLQPMTTGNERYWITFNGEVFNFLELREELIELGHKFNSDTDTEVVIAAYNQWGLEAFHRFNGMWALALWDQEEKTLTLCRDRYGIKPLYYLDRPNEQFAFASETNAFDKLSGYKKEINPKNFKIGIDNTYQLVGSGHSLFKDIYQLLPGHYIQLRAGEAVKQKRWYSIHDHVHEVPDSYEEQVQEFQDIFRESVKIRMRSDVPLATALSGGVDSTAVYSMVYDLMKNGNSHQRIPNDWQKAFIAVFPGTDKDERRFAEKAIEFTGGEANYLEPNYSNLTEDILRTTKAFDSISSTPLLALTNVYKGMHDANITVSLDGHGVDEMLYGYGKMIYDGFEHYKWNGHPDQSHALKEVLIGLYGEDQRSAKRERFDTDIKSAFIQRNKIATKIKNIFRSNEVMIDTGIIHNLPELSDKPYDFSDMDPFQGSVYREFFQATLPTLLRNFDKASMLNHVEIRMPFMDHRLVEYAFSLPFLSKIGGGFTKRIVRDSMKGIMPEANRIRTFKVGLGAPTNNWFQDHIKELVQDISHDQSFMQSSLWDGNVLSNQIDQNYKDDSWDLTKAAEVWKYLNAHIITNG